jgi:hypothetical protein
MKARKRSRARTGQPPGTTQAQAPVNPEPPFRNLQIFSFDPSNDVDLKTASVSRSTLKVRWETLAAGPVGEYVEVIDIDPPSGCVYDPVDLTDPHLLAQDGMTPSTGNPQFHQQMVYAVIMKTVQNFEQALGRPIFWGERARDEFGYIRDLEQRYVQRLRVYPHALREENAYYSPAKKALLFGYFNARTSDPREEVPGSVVFSCLSHHIVAHETSHAILDGLHPRLLEATNPDMLAFHEAFADLVAIFQTFTLPGVLQHQIQFTRGDLRTENLLVRLAPQFARATGRGGALRNALGEPGPDGRTTPPDPADLTRATKPHTRGAILVAAVFDAFLQMYENRIADLRRIGTGGTGVLPKGDIHPDLAHRFAEEAALLSQRVLNICIRALDYLPPVDLTFGDFLQALITSDADFFPDDPGRYRLAFIDAFRNRGIYPFGVRAMGQDILRWKPVPPADRGVLQPFVPPVNVLRSMAYAYDCEDALQTIGLNFDEDALYDLKEEGDLDRMASSFVEACWRSKTSAGSAAPSPHGKRYSRFLVEKFFAKFLQYWIVGKAVQQGGVLSDTSAAQLAFHLGLDIRALKEGRSTGARLEVHAVRPTVRFLADGRTKVELLVILTQRLRLALAGTNLSFNFRGGCTLIIDPETGTLRYAISKNLSSPTRQARQAAFLLEQLERLGPAAIDRFHLDGSGSGQEQSSSAPGQEPFALTHRATFDGDVTYG